MRVVIKLFVLLALMVSLANAQPVETLKKKSTPVKIPSAPEMVKVQAGTFEMGHKQDRDAQVRVNKHLLKLHTVTLDSFYIAKYKVSKDELDAFMKDMNAKPWNNFDETSAITTWYIAIEYCNWRSRKDGLKPCYLIDRSSERPEQWTVDCSFLNNGYRLPTEAEWEFAARGGVESKGYSFSGGAELEDVCPKNSKDEDSNSKMAKNELGIVGMSCTPNEWCWDWYKSTYYFDCPSSNPKGPETGIYKVYRGSKSGTYEGYNCIRGGEDAIPYSNIKGFRLVRRAK